MSELNLIASCAFGLESIVRYELTQLGYEGRIVQPGQIEFTADYLALCRANMWLRTADRVRIKVAQFSAANFDELFETTKAIDWTPWLPKDAEFPVNARTQKSQLTSVPAIQRAVKKAIATSLQHQYQAPLPESGSCYPIDAALHNDMATLTLDTTGASLHKRGYRSRNGPAPLKETLAAALVQLSFWKAGRPLIDPFCGTGTVPIEAAMLGRDIAPGRKRNFLAEDWPWINDKLWAETRTEAEDRVLAPLDERLMGTDRDEFSLKLARDHIHAAGVETDIHLQQKDFEALSSKRLYGCVITNPPYGQRIGEDLEMQSLYESMPSVLSRLPTWSHFVLTAFPNFEAILQRSADRRRKLYNGRIECTYFQFHGPKPLERSTKSNITHDTLQNLDASKEHPNPSTTPPTPQPKRQPKPPAFGGLTPKATHQAELFRSRLAKRARHLRRWPTRQKITCFRLYERDIPEVPLVVDRYEEFVHIVEFERPHDRDRAQQEQWLNLMAQTAAETLEVPLKNVFLKKRRRQKGLQQHEKCDDQGVEVVVNEGGLKFLVNLTDYTDTGLFLDHRLTRQRVRQDAHEKRFLNLFAYTGAFTVYAADGGASSTLTVDLSPVYQSWAQRNLEMNNLGGRRHQFVRSDALSFLRSLPKEPTFDLAVVDPPTFSNSKRTDGIWDVQRDYVECLNSTCQRMQDGGVIYFSTNFKRFKFEQDRIEATTVHEISRQTVPDDYRNQRIHRCWRIVR